MCFSAMTNVVTPGLAVTYIRSTGEPAPATIIGRCTHGDDFIHLKYMRNGHEPEHHAPFDCVLLDLQNVLKFACTLCSSALL